MRPHELQRLRTLLNDVEWEPAERALFDAALLELERPQQQKPTLQTLFGQAPAEPAPAADLALHFRIPRPPAAKNSRRIYRTGPKCRACNNPMGPLGTAMSDEAAAAVAGIQAAAIDALRRQAPQAFGERRPLLVDEDARIEVVHYVANDVVDVLVRSAGPKPKGTTGRKRDVHNVPELICDTLQGIAFANDNQVVDLRCWRSLGAAT